MKGLFKAVFNKEAYFPRDQFFVEYYKNFEKLNPVDKCEIIEEIQIHLQEEYDRNRKLADREYASTNNEGDFDYRSGYHSGEILYSKNRPIEISEQLRKYNISFKKIQR